VGIIILMSAVAASGFPWRHVIVFCAVVGVVGIVALVVGRARSRRSEPPADDGNPIINALLWFLNFWP
jgi:hypothetical protein